MITLCHSLSLVITHCHSLCHLLSLVVARCHSLSLDISLVCLFINDRLDIYTTKTFPENFSKKILEHEKLSSEFYCGRAEARVPHVSQNVFSEDFRKISRKTPRIGSCFTEAVGCRTTLIKRGIRESLSKHLLFSQLSYGYFRLGVRWFLQISPNVNF